MQQSMNPTLSWLAANVQLVVPLALVTWMAVGDVITRRIPNYLTLGTALAGLGFQLGFNGPWGLLDGFLGLLLGFCLLIGFYALGGMGAGDVKALAALGAWLGPKLTFYLFIYMALAGGLLVVVYFALRRSLWRKLGQLGSRLWSAVLLRSARPAFDPPDPEPEAVTDKEKASLPYALAMALGMAILLWRGTF